MKSYESIKTRILKTAQQYKEVQQAVKLSIASNPNVQHKRKPALVVNTFADRIKTKGRYYLRADLLLDVTESTKPETIRTIAKYWKHKYHPDKGGDAEIFNRIVKAEKELLEQSHRHSYN